jgi:hypothetical protein
MFVQFKVKLERYKDTQVLHVYLPFDVYETFGTRSRVAVKGTINGFPFRSSIFPMGPTGGGKFYMVVNREMREGAKVKGGDVAEFVMEKDDEPRSIVTPPDLVKALRNSRTAQSAWDKLSYTHRKEYIGAIEEAKKPETRARRIAKAVEMLAGMKRPETKSAAKAAKAPAKKTSKQAARKAAKKSGR